ncbi:hypothetical protein [Pontivivens nitratireducens]|uniref:hypothetical protein n=1 Tax=Pontivivens nitratireducens TaxID=2758038 RepID=UPI0016399B49|nr:hypothetical protein [Pontibrevibacter nitratireducens]
MIRVLLLLLLLSLAACNPALDQAGLAPRSALLAKDVVMTIRVDFRNDAATADAVAAETARLLGPEFQFRTMTGRELILNMTGRLTRVQQDGTPTLIMDWDVRDQGGTSIALFRVAIVTQTTLSGGISNRDRRGLAFYTAEKLTQQDGIREIVRARRSAQGS